MTTLVLLGIPVAGLAKDSQDGQAIAGPFNPGFPFDGQLAEVAYYNAALDTQTIQNIGLAAASG